MMQFIERPAALRGQPVPEERLRALEELGLLLKSIYLRVQKDGYRLVDGKLIGPND